MRILLATESYWPNHDGGALFEHRLVLDLVKKGHDVDVIAPSVNPNARFKNEIQQDNGSTIHRMRSGKLLVNKKISHCALAIRTNSADSR